MFKAFFIDEAWVFLRNRTAGVFVHPLLGLPSDSNNAVLLTSNVSNKLSICFSPKHTSVNGKEGILA